MLNNHETSNMKTSWWFAWSTNRSRPFDSFPTNQRREVDRHGLVDFQNHDPHTTLNIWRECWVCLFVCSLRFVCVELTPKQAPTESIRLNKSPMNSWATNGIFFHKYYFPLFSRLKKKRREMLRIQILQVTIEPCSMQSNKT